MVVEVIVPEVVVTVFPSTSLRSEPHASNVEEAVWAGIPGLLTVAVDLQVAHFLQLIELNADTITRMIMICFIFAC